MPPTPQLSLQQLDLAASAEWSITPTGWCLVRLNAGVAYCFGAKATQEIGVGELIIVPPKVAATFRASQIGPAQLHFFDFQPELLGSLLTLNEREQFAARARSGGAEIRVLPASDPAAAQLTTLCSLPQGANRLQERCQMLALAATLFPTTTKPSVPNTPANANAAVRFVELIESMAEEETLNHSPAELAKLCRCSPRHFARLFQAHFGTSVRARQTQMRLEKARRLLVESDAKVINVALDSGYRHLGLFNAMFKRHFGVTPTELRRSGEKRPRARVARPPATLALLLACLFPFYFPFRSVAKDVPAAAPASTAGTNGSPTFAVEGYAIEGNTLLTADHLHKILDARTGPDLTFDKIREGLAELQLAYRGRGYVSVAVSLPQQQLTNGIVKVRVTEGRLAEINVVGNHYYTSNNVLSALPSLRTNSILNGLVLQQELDRANLNRDRQIYPEISPGPEPGTSALQLKIKDRLPLHARVELDNYATPGTPELRLNTAVQYNNLWQLDHQVGVQYAFSPTSFKEGSANFYDEPLIANYSAFYRMPLGNFNELAPRRDIGISDFGYDEATKRFRPPAFSGGSEAVFYMSRSDSDTGLTVQSDETTPNVIPPTGGLQIHDQVFNQTITVNEDLGFRISDPLPNIWGFEPTVSAGLDYKNFRSHSAQSQAFSAIYYSLPNGSAAGPPFILNTTASNPPPVMRPVSSIISYLPIAVAGALSRADKQGSTAFNVNSSFNVSGVLGGKTDFQQVANSTRANGNYVVTDLALSREQKLFGEWSLRLSADGQWANQPLINNEQFGIGGNSGVRGYREGQEYGDTGWRVLFEPHANIYATGMEDGATPIVIKFSVFTDYGRRYLLDAPMGTPDAATLWGVGFGLSGSFGKRTDLRFTLAAPLKSTSSVGTGSARFTFAAAVQF